MAATQAALASGGMTHCYFRCGLRVFFSASARSCCRWRVRRSSVRRPPLPAVAMSNVPGRPAVWNSPTRSTWPRPPHQRSAASPDSPNACESAPPPTPLRPAAGASWQPWRHWSQAPLQILAVAPAFTTVRGIGFQQNAGLQQLLCRMFPAMDKGVELLSLRIVECHNVFLDCAFFAAHVSAPSLVTRTSIQRTLTESMTTATSGETLLRGSTRWWRKGEFLRTAITR